MSKCEKGEFTIGEGGPGTLVVYSVGNPKFNSGIRMNTAAAGQMIGCRFH
jgi:hypothetical protein